MHTAKWPDLQAEAKNWITDHRHNRISVSTKITSFKARRQVATYGIPFSRRTSSCYRFCGQTVRREKSVKSLKKHISNVSVLQMI
jgi:hypothetical protein